MSTNTTPTETLVARWETKGHDFLELHRGKIAENPDMPEVNGKICYSYRGKGQGGAFLDTSDEGAIEQMQRPWGHPEGAGAVTVLASDRPSLKRVL